jgi:hypothetical protein
MVVLFINLYFISSPRGRYSVMTVIVYWEDFGTGVPLSLRVRVMS